MLSNRNNLAYQNESYPQQALWSDNDNLLNILLVEDDFSDAMLTMRSLKATYIPYHVDCIANGRDVMPYLKNCAQTRLPDVMFLDIGLPDTNGFDILAMLVLSPPSLRAVPIVLTTGYSHFEYLPKSYQLPIYGYVNKPIRPGDLEPILSKVSSLR